MDETAHHCPTCGAPFRIRNRYVKVVACEFCGHVALYDGVRLDPTGRTAGLADLPSPLSLDATGRQRRQQLDHGQATAHAGRDQSIRRYFAPQ